MKLARWLLLLTAMAPAPALADLTATYAAPGAHRATTVEIASNGDFRTDSASARQGFIVRGDDAYWIQIKPTGPIVMRVSDIEKIVAAYVKAAPAKRDDPLDPLAPVLIGKGRATINGRVGDAYYTKGQSAELSPQPFVVISRDPALMPLGKALARLLAMSDTMSGQNAGREKVTALVEILSGGGPILSPDGELQSVSFAPVAATRFELPVPPLSLDETRRALAPPAP
jgi:hypothetical protein